MSMWPEPAEGSGGQQGVDESIGGLFDDISPGLAFPNAIAKVAQAVGEKRRSAGHAEDVTMRRTGRDRMPAEIRDNNPDDQAVREPQSQKFRHHGRAAGKYRQNPHRALLV